VKRVLLAPVTALPLDGRDAVHRLKLLAGPRWTPGLPGRNEAEAEVDGEGRDGWVKISEERFLDGRMNRKSVSDMLERLVQAANVSEMILPSGPN
jgi:small subunit ribosomal protein S35